MAYKRIFKVKITSIVRYNVSINGWLDEILTCEVGLYLFGGRFISLSPTL